MNTCIPAHAHIDTEADFHRRKSVSVYSLPFKTRKSHTCTRIQGIKGSQGILITLETADMYSEMGLRVH